MFNQSLKMCSALLIISTFFCLPVQAFQKDQFLYKIIDEIYTLEEVKEIYFLLNDLKCVNKDYFILDVLPKEFLDSVDEKEIFQVKKYQKVKIFSTKQVYTFNIIKRIIKLGTYVKSQNIELNKNLISLNLDLAKKNGCRYKPNSSLVSQSVFRNYWEMLMKIEVFLNVQFSNKNTKNKDNSKEKRQEVAFLIDSIEKQIKEELFW